MISWVLYVAAGLVVGGAAGYIIGRLDDFSLREKKELQNRLDQSSDELTSYKNQVSEHFVATATLVNNMTQSYQAVHEHLAKGAQTLGGDKIEVEKLSVQQAAGLDMAPMLVNEISETPAQSVTTQSLQLQEITPDEVSPEVVPAAEKQSARVESSVTESVLSSDTEESLSQVNAGVETAPAEVKGNRTNYTSAIDAEAGEESVADIAPDVPAVESGYSMEEKHSDTRQASRDAADSTINEDPVSVVAGGEIESGAEHDSDKTALTDENAITSASRMVH